MVLFGILTSLAHDFEVDGIYYKFNNSYNPTEAKVTYRGQYYNSYSNEYTGVVNIPSTVSYNGTTYPVTAIDVSTFYNCSGLTSVTIPGSVTSIGGSSFYGCSSLTGVTIPNSVTTIGNSAFQGCTALDTLNFNAISCNDFSSSASYHPFPNLSISNINIGEGVQKIPAYFAYGNTNLTSITIPDSVITIGNYAFQGCIALGSLNFNAISCNDFSSTASYHPFYNLNILNINIGNCVQRIPDFFAYGNTNLTSVIIPNSVTSIGKSAFYGCSGLTSVTIGSSVTSIGDYAFCGCDGITDYIWNARNCSYNGQMPTYNIEQVTIGNEVEVLPYDFVSGSKITSIDIPNSVISIGDCAFAYCGSLTSVTIGNSVISFGRDVFYDCSAITSIIVASGNTVYDSRNNCNAIIETASNKLLFGCMNTTIPNSVTAIAPNAFVNINLETVTIPENVSSISEWSYSVYDYKKSPKESNEENNRGMMYADAYQISAFENCGINSLTWNAIDCGDPSIDYAYIYELTDGSYFDLSKTYNPLFPSSNIKNVTIGEQVETIPSYFVPNSEITEIIIPSSVQRIGYNAFNDCTNLKTIDWRAENCDIETHVDWYWWDRKDPFGNDTVSRINIDSGVKTIGNRLFFNCHVDTVTCYATVPPEISDYYSGSCFDDSTYANAVLCVPEGSLSDYKNADGWKEFLNMVTIDGGEAMRGDVDGDNGVSISDVTALIDYLLSGNAAGINLSAADCDNDSIVNIADVTALIDYLLAGHW